ncbi:THO complex subunit 3 [Seminavis robusta]|uniref:THO complex subunit 3 n=1 Tax=Seminavis robusta TaxID=568900 RepID=A0A9N8EA55_9STRA|nr:THO complex subunit 3 [Seminavis robusta]|eukprot:Sro827_g207850.1 THO complex subunit 3 (384) ;mRNA; f:26535-27862
MKISDVSLHECGGYHHDRSGARSVSWNKSGSWLAMGGSSPRIWSIEGAIGSVVPGASGSASSGQIRCSEILVISGHNAAVDIVRFHPNESNCLCTSAGDATIRVFDIRAGAERAVGRIDVQAGKSANYIDWSSTSSPSGGMSSSHIAVTERDGAVHVYDSRKLSSGSTSLNNRGARSGSTTSTKSTPLSTFRIPKVDIDTCIFSPSGLHLVAATVNKGVMISDLRIWNWKDGSDAFLTSVNDNTQFKVPAHTGPILSMQFSPDGKRLATGSFDSIVGIWDVATMSCQTSISRRLKVIRGVGFSHDSRFLATCNEEDGIDIANASTGDQVGQLQLRENPSGMGPTGGADEVKWNPNAHIVACARAPTGHSQSSAAVVIRCRVSA